MISSLGTIWAIQMIGLGGLAAGLLDLLLHLAADLRGVRGPGAEDDLDAGPDVLDRVDQVDDPLLPGDPADEEDVRLVGVDLVLRQDGRVGRRPCTGSGRSRCG